MAGRKAKLSKEDLYELKVLLDDKATDHGFHDDKWSNAKIREVIINRFGVSYHPAYIGKIRNKIEKTLPSVVHYFSNDIVTLYHGDAKKVLSTLRDASVDSIVTSPPYYGQRDYGVVGQIGLEDHPQKYVDNLVSIFEEAKRVLKPTGSLWVNLGDTYWSGKGTPQGIDSKGRHRRFTRPQDRSGPRPLCTPKQLLLIPHRFAIAMQDRGWIVRNDNVWYKENPTPDPVSDRCASAHEYMFHFVLQRHYYFNKEAVSIPSKGERNTKSPPSVWRIKSAPTFKKHIATFPEELVRIPILATLPKGGTLLDPFCGSGTALSFALVKAGSKLVIGVDISESALKEAQELLSEVTTDV